MFCLRGVLKYPFSPQDTLFNTLWISKRSLGVSGGCSIKKRLYFGILTKGTDDFKENEVATFSNTD